MRGALPVLDHQCSRPSRRSGDWGTVQARSSSLVVRRHGRRNRFVPEWMEVSGMHCKLVIADDYQLMLAAIRLALADAPDMEIVGEAHGGRQLLPLVGRTSPDVVLLDLRMPGMDGLRCLELLRERHPQVKAIIFSGNDDTAAVDAAFLRGAVAFIRKTIIPADLAAVVRQAIAGDVFFTAGKDDGPAPPVESPWHLTPRETEILRALAGGQSNKQMAREFWLSEQTIKYHLTNIYRKLGVNSRTGAVRQAY